LSIFKINIYIQGVTGVASKKLIVINKGDYYKILPSFARAGNSVRKVNIILLQLLIATLARSGKTLVDSNASLSLSAKGEKLIYVLFRYFKFKYYENFVQKYLKKEVFALNYLYMLSLNSFKFDRFLPGLKHLISRIYNKKVELNLVNLKYLHLNSDIFSESIAIKLRKKKNSLLRVLRGSLKLVKIPSKRSSALLAQTDLIKENNVQALGGFRPLDNYKALSGSTLSNKTALSAKDVLHVVLSKMFPTAKSEASTQLATQQNKSIVQGSAVEASLLKVPSSFAALNTEQVKAKRINALNSIKFK